MNPRLGLIAIVGAIGALAVQPGNAQSPEETRTSMACLGRVLTLESGRYCVYDEQMNWGAARRLCSVSGGHLLEIDDVTESREIHHALGNPAHNPYEKYWFGAHDTQKEGTWKWVDGSPVDPARWATDEPNDYHGEDCLVWENTTYRWNDVGCEDGYGYVCERRDRPDHAWCLGEMIAVEFVVDGGPDVSVEFCVHKERLTWPKAREACSEAGAQFATVKHDQEWAEIIEVLGSRYYWLGYTDRIEDGDWWTTRGTQPLMANWDTDLHGPSEACAVWKPTTGKWTDGPCTGGWSRGYTVCEEP